MILTIETTSRKKTYAQILTVDAFYGLIVCKACNIGLPLEWAKAHCVKHRVTVGLSLNGIDLGKRSRVHDLVEWKACKNIRGMSGLDEFLSTIVWRNSMDFQKNRSLIGSWISPWKKVPWIFVCDATDFCVYYVIQFSTFPIFTSRFFSFETHTHCQNRTKVHSEWLTHLNILYTYLCPTVPIYTLEMAY